MDRLRSSLSVLRRLASVWAVVALATFAYLAVTFERPRYERLEGYGRVPVEVAGDLKRDGCLDRDEVSVCTVAWRAPCADRVCLLGDAAWIGAVAVLVAVVGVAIRATWRRQRARLGQMDDKGIGP